MHIDLLDPASFAAGHPAAQYRWLREHDPVHFHAEPEGPGFWALTRWADVKAVGRDAETFSSAHPPTILIPDETAVPVAGSEMMLTTDPPRHTAFRLLLNREFTRRAVDRRRARVAELAARIVDAVCERGECDLVTDIAGEMPSYVVADLLGLPLDDGRELYKLTETIHAAPESQPEGAGIGAVLSMFNYAHDVAESKRRTPGQDLSTVLLDARLEGRPLTEGEFNLFFLLLVDAGGDTTRNLVAGGMQALFEHPGERRRLQGDLDALMPTAMEELLRWVSPVVYMRRTATRDTTLGGQRIAAGDKVVMYYGAANRDPDAFDDAERLDLGRTPNEHVAFGGGGPHFCLGSHLARVEIDLLLREVLTRLGDVEPAGAVEWLPSTFISGPRHLPVRFTPSAPRRG